MTWQPSNLHGRSVQPLVAIADREGPLILVYCMQGTRRLQALTQVTELEDVPNVPRSSGEVSEPHTKALSSTRSCKSFSP